MERRRRGKERRLAQRLLLAVPVFARGKDDGGKEFLEFTTTLNISANGALLATRRHLAPETKITLEIPAAPLPRLASKPHTVRTLEARVVRVVQSEPSYLSALSFSHPIT
ncbi:MAG: PilZ domain-containing protein [Terriglobia bacterium]